MQPLGEHLAGDRERQHRADQVRAAALVLLRHLRRVPVLLVAADRLVLDGVVGGERRVAQRGERRQRADQRDRELAPDGRRRRGGAAGSSRRRWRARRRSRAGPRTAAAPSAAAAGRAAATAIASASRSGPRTSGVGARRPRARLGFGPEATSIEPSAARAATAHEVGPWISRPLRSAIPPRRRRSGSAGPEPFGRGAVGARLAHLAPEHPPAEVGVEVRRQLDVGDRGALVGAVDERRGLEQPELALRAEAVDGRGVERLAKPVAVAEARPSRSGPGSPRGRARRATRRSRRRAASRSASCCR